MPYLFATVGPQLAEWETIGLAAISVAFAFTALAYMIGAGFNISTVKSWAKNEFYQACASAAMLGLFLIALMALNSVMYSITGDPVATCPLKTECPASYGPLCDPASGLYSRTFDTCLCFLGSVRDWLIGVNTVLNAVNLIIGTASSISISEMPYQFGPSFMIAPGAGAIIDGIRMMSTITGAGIALVWGQMYLLSFIRLELINLLPIGIALRAFPFTRGAGAALIALIVGLFFVYPTLLALEARFVVTDIETTLGGGWEASTAQMLQPANLIVTVLTGGLGLIISFLPWLVSIGQFLVYYVVIVALFLPVLNLTLTFSFMKDFAGILGGDIDVNSLAQLL